MIEYPADIPIVNVFSADFDVSLLDEAPSGSSLQHLFARTGRIIDGGVMVRVSPRKGDPWNGIAAYGAVSVASAFTGVFTTPSARTLCLVARGDAYLVDVYSPEEWSAIEDSPVIAVRSAPDDAVLVLATPWRVVGVGANGVAWRTGRLAIDGLQLNDAAHEGSLTGVADPGGVEPRPFEIDLTTGRHTGGFAFPSDQSI